MVEVHGTVGPSGWMDQEFPDARAFHHTTAGCLWIFAVHHDRSTKMVGVTIEGGAETGPRIAKYVPELVDLSAASVSEAWDRGVDVDYSEAGGYVLLGDLRIAIVAATGAAAGAQQDEPSLEAIATTRWENILPNALGCAAELRGNQRILGKVPCIARLCDDVEFKVRTIEFAPGMAQFSILDAQSPHRFKVSSTDGEEDGWTLRSSFWAHATAQPGMVQFNILDALSPHRFKVSSADGEGAGWTLRSSFWAWAQAPPQLACDELFAISAYTYDFAEGNQAGNLYFELNLDLRKRELQQRAEMMQTWGVLMHYFMSGMKKLPDYRGVVYRGYPNKAQVLAEYLLGRPIQWGGFTSTATSLSTAKSFTDLVSGAIFKITILDGRDLARFSFFPSEGEVLLSPSHRFTVASDPYVQDGYTLVDLVQISGAPFVS